MNDLELSADTLAVMECLKAASIGDTVTYDELSNAIGRDIRQHRHIIYTALNALSREDGLLFSTVRGVGYQRVPAGQAHHIGVLTRKGIRRKARRSSKRISRTLSRANDVSDEERRKAHSELGTLNLIEHLSRDTTQPRKDEQPTSPEPVAFTARRMLSEVGR